MTPPEAGGPRRSETDASLRSLVARHAPGLRAYLSRLERDPQDVEEVLADVFYLAHAHVDTLAGLSEPQVRVWLYRTAKLLNANRSRSKFRRRQVLERLSHQEGFVPPDGDEFDAVDAAVDRPEHVARVTATMASLRPEHREVLVLDALGRTGPEIAAELGISAVAARKRLMHARVAFRAAWVPDGQAGRVDGTTGTPLGGGPSPGGGPSTERSRP